MEEYHDRQVAEFNAEIDAAVRRLNSKSGATGQQYAPPQEGYDYDLDCADIDGPVWVGDYDPHRLDADGDGWGCDWG